MATESFYDLPSISEASVVVHDFDIFNSYSTKKA